MTTAPVDSRLAAALDEQHAQRKAALRAGATHVGWKLGVGRRESISGDIAIGYLTSATCLAAGAEYAPSREDQSLHVDVELVVEFGADVSAAAATGVIERAITGYGVAIEIVDLSPLANEPEGVVAANLFHRAVAFGPAVAELPRRAVASITSNGRHEASSPVAADVLARLARATWLLAAVGERFRAGDRVITGSLVQVPVDRGDKIVAAISGIGDVALVVKSDRR